MFFTRSLTVKKLYHTLLFSRSSTVKKINIFYDITRCSFYGQRPWQNFFFFTINDREKKSTRHRLFTHICNGHSKIVTVVDREKSHCDGVFCHSQWPWQRHFVTVIDRDKTLILVECKFWCTHHLHPLSLASLCFAFLNGEEAASPETQGTPFHTPKPPPHFHFHITATKTHNPQHPL